MRPSIRIGVAFAAVHLGLWVALLASREPIPRRYLTEDPTVVEGPTMQLNSPTDSGTMMFSRPFGGPYEAWPVFIALIPNLPALRSAEFARDFVDWRTPYDKYELSLLTGVAFLAVSSLQWFLVGWVIGIKKASKAEAAV